MRKVCVIILNAGVSNNSCVNETVKQLVSNDHAIRFVSSVTKLEVTMVKQLGVLTFFLPDLRRKAFIEVEQKNKQN